MNRFEPTPEELAEIDDYESALDDAEAKGEPWFSLTEFRARYVAPKKTEPAPPPEACEEIPF